MKLAVKRAWTLPAAALTSVSGLAQTVAVAPSQALRCLTPGEVERSRVVYPQEAYKRKEGGLVRVEMTFDDAGSPPSVKVLNEPQRELRGAVLDHLKQFRVPCLAPGQAAVIAQDFLFRPTDGRQVLWTNPRDRGDAARKASLGCLTAPAKPPSYPATALRREEQGVVALRLRFTDSSKAPEVTVLDETPDRSLIASAKAVAADYRLPCHAGEPTDIRVDYHFRIEGGERLVVKDLSLPTFLRALRDVQSAQVYFDFREMKCPFDLRVLLRQPVDDNLVGEVGESVPERAFFIDWLSRQRLKLGAKEQNLLMGQEATVSVPCTTLQLGSRPGGSASQ